MNYYILVSKELYVKKKIIKLLSLSILLLGTGCALSHSIRARTLLQNCGFEFERVDLAVLDIAPFVRFDGKTEKVSVENPPVTELLGVIPEITRGEFSLDFSELKFSPQFSVNNPNDQEVVLDSMAFEVYLDDAYLMTASHEQRVTIPAKQKDFFTVTINVPTDLPLSELIEAEKIRIKGTAFIKLDITPSKSVTLNVPIDLSKDIPRDQINAKINEEKEKIVAELLSKVQNRGAKSVLDALF